MNFNRFNDAVILRKDITVFMTKRNNTFTDNESAFAHVYKFCCSKELQNSEQIVWKVFAQSVHHCVCAHVRFHADLNLI